MIYYINKKYRFAIVLLIIFSAFVFYYHPSVSPIKVSYSKEGFPLIPVEIDTVSTFARLGLGNPSFLMMHPKAPVSKKVVETGCFAPLQKIQQIKVGNLELSNLEVTPSETTYYESLEGNTSYASLGSFLLRETPLLIDLPHDAVFLMREPPSMLVNFHSVPVEEWNTSFITQIETDRGRLKFLISFASRDTAIWLRDGETADPFTSQFFQIGEKDFGPKLLHRIPKQDAFNAFDGVLGLDFLSRCAVWIDLPKRDVRFGNPIDEECACLPLKWTDRSIPLLSIHCQGQNLTAFFDSGSSFPLLFSPRTLKKLNKFEEGVGSLSTIKGDTFYLSRFLLPDVSIGPLHFKKVAVFENPDMKEKSPSFGRWKKKRYEDCIGRPFLETCNLLFDFPRSKVWQVGYKASVERTGYRKSQLLEIPFELRNCGMVIEAQIDHHPCKLLVDTGATHTVLRMQALSGKTIRGDDLLSCLVDALEIASIDFGKQEVFAIQQLHLDEDRVDGVLGMDFLRKRVVFIDYPNRKLYFSYPE